MSGVDIKVVAIALVFAITYGIFIFLNANADTTTYDAGGVNASQYNTPEAGNFFSQLDQVKELNVNNPEIFFINSILFGTIAFLLVFVGLRFLRGTG